VGLLLTLAPTAGAATFCVDDPACLTAGGDDKATLQTAINAAEANGDTLRDRIEVGPGIQNDAPFTVDASNDVDIVGEGTGATTLTRTGVGNNEKFLTIADPSSTVSDLTVQFNASGAGLVGIQTAGVASRVAVTDPSNGTGRNGVVLNASGATLRDSSVALSRSTSTSGVFQPSGGPGAVSVERSQITAAEGISFGNAINVVRSRVNARQQGIVGFGSAFLDQTTVQLSQAGGFAVSAVSIAFVAPVAANLTLRHVTAVGPGAGGGVGVAAGCHMVGPGINNPIPAQANVRDTILRGFATDFSGGGTNCPDGFTNNPSPANISVAYSVFDPSKVAQSGPGGLTQGSGNLNVDPQFADFAGGNLRLVQGSPAIDLGDPAAPAGGELTVDLDGNARTQDGNGDGAAVRDIGAFEHTFVPPAVDGGGGGGGGGEPPPAEPIEITRALSLGYKAKKDKFKGALRSNEPACLAGKVKVFEKAKGKDPKVGSDKTNAAGKWAFEEKDADGKFYASVPVKTVPAGTCPAAKSRPKRVG